MQLLHQLDGKRHTQQVKVVVQGKVGAQLADRKAGGSALEESSVVCLSSVHLTSMEAKIPASQHSFASPSWLCIDCQSCSLTGPSLSVAKRKDGGHQPMQPVWALCCWETYLKMCCLGLEQPELDILS